MNASFYLLKEIANLISKDLDRRHTKSFIFIHFFPKKVKRTEMKMNKLFKRLNAHSIHFTDQNG